MATIGAVVRNAAGDGWTVPFNVLDTESDSKAENILICIHKANAKQMDVEGSAASAVTTKAAIDANVLAVMTIPPK